MTFRTPRARDGMRRRPRWLVPAAVTAVVLIVAIGVFTSIWTDVLWYAAVDYLSAYYTRLRARVVLFLVAALIMALVVGVNMVLAYRLRPPYRSLTSEQQGLERYRMMLEPRLGLALGAVLAAIGLIAGLAMEGRWQTWLMFLNQQPFGTQDPEFGKDIAYFVFTYPFLRMVVGFGFAVVVVSFIAAALTHYLYGGIRLQSEGEKIGSTAQAHLSVLAGIFVLLQAWAYWLDRYGLVFSQREGDIGAWYTDVNAVLPAKSILTVIALLCAGLFFASVIRRGLLLPAAALGLLVLSAILIGSVYPALIQRFQVEPTEKAREQPYIQRNIEATRSAYNVDDVQIDGYDAATDPSNVPADAQGGDIPGVRLLDPGVVPDTFQQLQQIRGFYQFPQTLDIGRYTVNGETRPNVVSVRGLEQPPQGRRNWYNSHIVYTHGFGFVGANASDVTGGGAPSFTASDIPPQGQLGGDYQPRVYFGQQVPGYSIVGAPQGASPQELDFPDDSPSGQQNNTYQGTGGVPIGSPLKRLAYALQFQDANIVLSDAVNGESRMMYIREPRQRIQRVAPFLELDGNPYPAIVNGRIKWIVDAYTSTSMYPYSNRTTLGEATRDATTVTSQAVAAQPEKQVNYLRNSVKVTVDAYSGDVNLYQWNQQDPMLQAWSQAFPDLVKPRSAIPDALMEHLRYPEDLFKVQRNILERYHVTEASAFYDGQDFWTVPDDPTGQGAAQPPYYLNLQMPGTNSPEYSLTTTYVPRDRPNLAAFMAVDSSPGENYGQLRILRLPRSTAIAGPGQMQNDFQSDARVRQNLALLQQGDANLTYGNMLTLPVGGGLLYVEPVYVRASGGQSYPLVQRVLVSFGGEIGYAATLDEALGQIFEGAGAQAPSGDTSDGDGQQTGGGATNQQVQQALEDAQQAYEDAQEALQNGDFQAYGEAQQRLQEALDEATQAQGSGGSGGGSEGGS